MPLLVSLLLLHIPDGFLDNAVSILCWVLSLTILAVALRRAQAGFSERLVPLAGVLAAFIFAAQMINFPVLGGTSGHLIGASLAFIVLGPWLGLLVMTAVIGLQALLFQDGGLVSMGANILVMGIVPGFVAYGIYGLTSKRARSTRLAAAGIAAWISVVLAAFVTALLLGASGTANLALVVPLMVGVHMLIGVGEALVTVAALVFLLGSRPEILAAQDAAYSSRWALAGLGIVLLVLLLAPLASSQPDGLEWVAGQQAFLDEAQAGPYELLPDYTIPGLQGTAASTILAGVIGALLVVGVIFLLGRILNRNRQRKHDGTHV